MKRKQPLGLWIYLNSQACPANSMDRFTCDLLCFHFLKCSFGNLGISHTNLFVVLSSVGTLPPCCPQNVFTFRICLAHVSSECPAVWWSCQAYWFQIHESGETLQWAAFGQEEGDLWLVSKSQHLFCAHGDTAFLWPLQRWASGLQGGADASEEASWKGETKERRREESSKKEIVLVSPERDLLLSD